MWLLISLCLFSTQGDERYGRGYLHRSRLHAGLELSGFGHSHHSFMHLRVEISINLLLSYVFLSL